MKTGSLAKKMLLTAALLVAATSALAQWVDITDPGELRDMFSDRRFTVTTEDGKPWNMSVNKSNGHGFVTGRSGREFTREWVVKGDRVCNMDHLPGLEGVWLCRMLQRHETAPGLYRSIGTETPPQYMRSEIPKILHLQVDPAPDYRKNGSKVVG